MKTKNIILKNQDIKSLFFSGLKLLMITLVFSVTFSCSSEDDCEYIIQTDCPELGLNIGEFCSVNNDGILNGTVNDVCECIPNGPTISLCPGFIQNGDFEIITGDPNASVDNDINLATGWKPIWQGSASLADLFDNATTNYGAICFASPSPASGVFAGMWVENNINAQASKTFREGFFNELNSTINQNSGNYTLSFDFANMSSNCGVSNDVKVGVYGVYFPLSGTLPATPTGVGVPSNIDLFGASDTVYLGEVTISSSTTNIWQQASFTIDTSSLTFPTNGVNHIMITNSHLPFNDFGRMFVGFDNFCLIN